MATLDKLMLNGNEYKLAYDATITINKNWIKVDDFTLNQSSNKTINIAVPTSSDYVDLTSNQSVGGTKTFTTSPVVPAKTSDASASNTTVIATEAQVAKKQDALTAWSNIQIQDVQGTLTISATDTTYSEVTTADMNTGTSTTAGIVSAKGIADYVKGKVSNAYIYKGSVSTYGDLPSTGLTAWDVYNVATAHSTAPKFPAGSNLAWTGTEWDVLGWIFDTSDFVDLSTNQTIWGTKTFSVSPVVPSKSSSAGNNPTVIATEAQVYAVSWAIPTVNDATLTLTQGGASKGTFTANSATATTIDFNTSFIKTATEYSNLPSSKNTDWNFYFIYSA